MKYFSTVPYSGLPSWVSPQNLSLQINSNNLSVKGHYKSYLQESSDFELYIWSTKTVNPHNLFESWSTKEAKDWSNANQIKGKWNIDCAILDLRRTIIRLLKEAIHTFEEIRAAELRERRTRRKANTSLPPTTLEHMCIVFDRACRSKFGLASHKRRHQPSNTAT